MSLVKWFRKNNSKIMAIVVIVLMIGFIGGSALTYLLQGSRGLNDAVATIAGKKITHNDLMQARQELELLRMLRADDLLRAQDLLGVFLAELLFSADRGGSPDLIGNVKAAIRRNLYTISDKQINDLYRRNVPPHVYWCCLKAEVRRAGIGVQKNEVGAILGSAIPQLFNGQSYSQLIGPIIDKQRIPEEEILATVGRLLSVLQYGQIMCSNEGLTAQQILYEASVQQESIDVGYVEFDAEVFADANGPAPGEEELKKHFDKYKTFFPGDITDDNPHGFGYKQPDLVSLEYIAVKLDDVRRIVAPPTQDEIGDYYSRHKEQLFTEQVPSDPNDPNSPTTEQVRSYAEVAGPISKQLLADKINSKADGILQEARTLTEVNQQEESPTGKPKPLEQLKEKAVKYEDVAKKLSDKYQIKVYVGRTGRLNALDVQMDEYIGSIFLRGYGPTPIGLSQAAFAVDPLGVSELGPFDVSKPRLYENIGPLKDPYGAGSIMAIVRVVDARKAEVPENIDLTYSTRSVHLDPNDQGAEKEVYSVKEKVVEDLKKLKALGATKTKAEEFVNLVAMDGWDKAIGVFEKLYGQAARRDPNDPNAFRLQNQVGLRRVSLETLETLAVQSQGQPAMKLRLNEIERDRLFIDKLYSLVPPDSNTVEALPVVMEYKPDLKYLVIKNISVNRLWKERFEQMKTASIFREGHAQSQSLAAVFFNPANVLKRVNFKLLETRDQATDANEPGQAEAGS
ncbi:MAG: hypothetical protein A2Z25_05160 [Planctomycetes bacterium RBG_16_55_9]|nr:MAG: hypothetical protein A2Z25_05160 [Planctomycetes bacterium RBG_16_55_9]